MITTKMEVVKHQTCEEQFPGLLAQFVSTLEVTRALLDMLVRFGLNLVAETAILVEGEALLKTFTADNFLPLSSAKKSRFETALFFARDFYVELKQGADRHLRNPAFVSWFEARIEVIADQVGSESARKLRLEIRAYASAVSSKESYATLRGLILAFEENLVRQERLAVAATIKAIITPAPIKRSKHRSPRRYVSKGQSSADTADKGRPNGKKARKATAEQGGQKSARGKKATA